MILPAGGNRAAARGRSQSPDALLQQGLEALDLDEAADTERLLAFVRLLLDWNRIYNLVSVRRPGDVVTRHILDSLAVAPYLRDGRVLDIGTGAGLPGIPLAIVFPEQEFVLLDSSSKKLRFVQQAITELGLENVRLEHTRIEDYRPEFCFDSITCRAFSELQELYRQAARLCAADGLILAMKGVYPMTEIEMLENKQVIEDILPLNVPGLDADRHLVRMKALVGQQETENR